MKWSILHTIISKRLNKNETVSKYNQYPSVWLFTLIIAWSTGWTDVSVSVGKNCQSFTIKNNTSFTYQLGGIRFYNRHTFWTSASDGQGAGWTMNHQTVDGRIQQELYFKSTAQGIAAPSGCKLGPGATPTFNRSWNTETDSAYPDMYLLLRTGYPGIPDEPLDASPVTLAEIDNSIAHPDFYNPMYKYSYVDSLGVNGGKYSGGFIDTWYNNATGKAETQIHFPIPQNNFNVNMTSVNFLSTGINHYWMSLAIGQEYFHTDMQWMAGMGAKETGIGTTFPVQKMNQLGVYGFWQVENTTGLDRALAYPEMFPKYSKQLSTARNVTTFGPASSWEDFMCYYTRGNLGHTPVNSALMLNASILSIIVQYANYYVCAASTDICWKEALHSAVDPYMGIGIMTVMYNLGQYSTIGNVASLLNPTSFATTSAKPNTRFIIGHGNSNYVDDILSVVQSAVNASRQYQKGNSNLKLVDFNIDKQSMRDMFFGDGGTVAKQGNGGLLLHYYDLSAGSGTAVRQQIWNTLDSAFEKLKGRAPTASETTISYRYDFLTILRSVKDKFPFIRQKMPSGGDASSLIPRYSGHYKPCNSIGTPDETYPYLYSSKASLDKNGNVTVLDTIVDETEARSINWTLDYTWSSWNDATPVDTTGLKKKTFSINASKDEIDACRLLPDGQSGRYIWIMATDGSGNSTIMRTAVPTEISSNIDRFPHLDSAIIQDIDGDGNGDKISVFLTKSSDNRAEELNSFTKFQYAWPSKVPLNTAVNVTQSGNILTIVDQSLTGSTGLGTVVLDYTSKSGIAGDIKDRIGPVLTNAILRMSNTKESPDTLQITTSEAIKQITSSNIACLNFKRGNDLRTPVTPNFLSGHETQWTLLFSNGSLDNYDSTNFINTTGKIFDREHNPPLDINRMVKIQKISAISNAALQKIVVYPNPFTPGQTRIPESLRNYSRSTSTGTAIEVKFTGPVNIANSISIAGIISIYDAVGNCVVKQHEMQTRFSGDSLLYAIWNGKDRKGKRVAVGTYIGVIEIKDISNGKKHAERVLIGVRKSQE
jgi:hypothetical protein